jgi:hypothetical protein
MTDSPRDQSSPLGSDSDDGKRAAEEYRAVVQLMGDTGRDIWVINGAYLLVLGVLLNSVLTFEPRAALPMIIRAFAGLFLATLWWASFKRNYSYYTYRIRLGCSLEERLFQLGPLRGGNELGTKGWIDVPGYGPSVRLPQNKVLPNSIEGLTEWLIRFFVLGFLALLGWGVYLAFV